MFLGSQPGGASPAQRELIATVGAANRAGVPVRVAVISSQYDLGSITALWRKPGLYARFLALELRSGYGGRLLVAMPNGFGFIWPGHSSTSASRLLGRMPLGRGSDGLASAAQTAVERLAAAAGARLAPIRPPRARPTSSGGVGAGVIVAAVLGGIAVIAALAIVLVRAGRRRGLKPESLRWAIAPAALLFVAAVALWVAALRRGSGTPAVSPASVVTPPPFQWRAGQRRAPDFALRDQGGLPVSVAAYRGRPVIVTFVDPLCRNLCPLEAQVLNQLERELPASQRPVILAVSVDVYSNANSREDLLQAVREWHLVPQWHWAVGSPRQLAAAWKRYKIGVSVVTKRVGGTTIHYVTHTEAAYVIDATGHERALFLWPFYPRDVRRALARLA